MMHNNDSSTFGSMHLLFYLVGIVIAAFLAKLGIVLLRADPLESAKNASRTQSFLKAVFGHVRIHDDWLPDARVKGGMVYNSKKKRIEVSGRISDDSLDRTYR